MATSSSSSYGIEQLQKRCYHEWMNLQARHMVDLKEAITSKNDRKLGELVGEIVNDFQKYTERRSELSHSSSSSYFSPSWNSSLENSLLWMGGCRPSSFIRVIYAMCGSQTETQLSPYLLKIYQNGDEKGGDGSMTMSELTSTQLGQINEIHIKVVEKEDKISKKAANLQDDVADLPIAVTSYATDLVEAGVSVEDALDKHEERLAVLMAEADKLRFETLGKIVEVMTPVQAADFLLAGNRLHVSLHEWGRVREERRFGCAHADDEAAARS